MSFCKQSDINMSTVVDIFPQYDYNTICNTHPSNLMTVSNIYGQKSKYRITLELDVFDDFNPRQIDWAKVFDLNEDESVDCYIEEEDYADSY